ncbi:MAG: maleylpyruvate isomerase family mycothiol-dependent enzyme [Ilumatobacteraceae bacterium]
MAHDEVFEAVAAERLALADMLEGLTPEQLSTPSLCAGWTVQEIGAHLTFLWTVSFPLMMWRVVKARGSFPRAVDRLTRERGHQPIDEIVAGLRANAHFRKHPPGVPQAPLTDAIVHGEDVRIPLGITREVPLPAVRIALDFVTSGRDRGTFLPRGRLQGLRLVATDQDWAWGKGEEISGPSLPLLTGVMGRTPALHALGGAVGVLQARV